MSTGRIPVIIVAGFLGSGKTTLLNHLLANNAGARIGVIVNDFGSINIDAMAVTGQVDSTVSLGNGCLCCAVDASGMDELLGRLARPGAELDAIVIEASGVADPRDMVRLVLSSEQPGVEYGGLIDVVDAAEFDTTRTEHPSVAGRLPVADLIVLNKTDRIESSSVPAVLRTVEQHAAGTPVVPVSHGRIPPDLLLERRPLPDRTETTRQLSFDDLGREDRDTAEHAHPHTEYDTVEFVSDDPLHPRALMRFLDERPAGLYRMKGFVYFGVRGHKQKFTLHTVGTHVRVHRSRWPRGENRRTRLVLIGRDIDRERLNARLRECVEPAPHSVHEQDMLPVLRYVRD